jgi:DNA repair exonuclease SbcCD ATPase subunit
VGCVLTFVNRRHSRLRPPPPRPSNTLQVRALQELLRSNAEELERYKKLVTEAERAGAAGGKASGAAGGDAAVPSTARQTELQERINRLRAEVKDLERSIAAVATTAAAASGAGGAGGDSELSAAAAAGAGSSAASEGAAAGGAAGDDAAALRARLAETKAALTAAEEEAEEGASSAVKATRMRERLERENREKVTALESALEHKVKEVAMLQETMSNLESAHSRDLETFIGKLNDKEVEVAALRGETKAFEATLDSLKAQVRRSKWRWGEGGREGWGWGNDAACSRHVRFLCG